MHKSITSRELIAVERVASDPRQKFLGKEFAELDRYVLQDALVDTLQRTKHHRHRAEALLNCHRTFRGWGCRNNHGWALAEKSCSLRICPHCCRRRSLVLAGRMEAFLVGKPRHTLRYMVFSERTCSDLAEGMESAWAAFARIRASRQWKRKVKGCIAAQEVTVRPNAMWHPHINVLAEGDYFPQEELVEMWKKATRGRGEIVWVRAADAGTVRELIKYVTKISDLVGNPIAVDEFLSAVYGKRLVRTYGSFYGLKLEEEEAPRQQKCPDCGCTEVVKLGLVKPQQVSMDFKGVLRIKRRHGEFDAQMAQAVQFDLKLPREKMMNYMPVLRKRWDKAGALFTERHDDLVNAAERLGAMRTNVIAGWGYSEWLHSLRGPMAS